MSAPNQPPNPNAYYPPAPGYAPAGFLNYGAQPPPMPQYAPSPQGFPPQQYQSQQAYPSQQQQQQPGYNPADATPPPQGAAYPPYVAAPGAPPPGGYPMPGAPGSMPSALPPASGGGMPGSAASAPAVSGSVVPGAPDTVSVQVLPEPSTVVYRDIMIHNPRFAGGLTVWNYEHTQIRRDVDEIIKDSGSQKRLVEILTRLGPLKMEVLAHGFHSYNPEGQTLYGFIERKTRSNVEIGLLGLVLGPLKYDVECVHAAIKRQAIRGVRGLVLPGTKEDVLNEIILDLTPSDVGLLAYAYEQKYHETLLKAVRGDLSGGVEKLFVTALNSKREYLPRAPVDGQVPDAKQLAEAAKLAAKQVTSDVKALKRNGEERPGTHEETFFTILTGRTHQHLLAVAKDYPSSGQKKPLSRVIKDEFSGDERDALRYIVRGLEASPRYPDLDPRLMREVELLEKTMKGAGTKDDLLIMRLLRAHWAPWRMNQIAAAYLRVHEKTLPHRVKGETSGAYEDLLVALIKGPATAY
ncbi:hypothetical protein C8R46DRAFT_1358766 [Mycena filopes]|nr:hypothetical protein C8R46DRAFT_1358766 [Mycena filopes]